MRYRHEYPLHIWPHLQLVNKLNTTDLTLSHLIKTIKHTLEATLPDIRPVNLDLAIREQLARQLPELPTELKVLRLRRDRVTSETKLLAIDGVRKGAGDLDVVAAGLVLLDGQQERDLAAL